MVSLKDIAAKCGVSVATVSKALNGQQDIGEATREKVISAAREMGYTANSAARALKTNRTYNLGIVLVDLQNSGFLLLSCNAVEVFLALFLEVVEIGRAHV